MHYAGHVAGLCITVPHWRHSLVVRPSRQTFLDLCLIYGWQVTILWVLCQLWVSHLG